MTINELWHSSDQTAWRAELDRSMLFVKPANAELVKELEPPDDEPNGVLVPRISGLDIRGWYDFLHDKYFQWKYTDPRRLTTTRKALAQYLTDGKLDKLEADELDGIRRRLLKLNRDNLTCSDVKSGLRDADKIKGLGIAGASGLLSLLYPRHFGTVDQFVVKALRCIDGLPDEPELSKMNPDSLTLDNGVLLVRIMRAKALELNALYGGDFWTPKRVDQILWTCGREPRKAQLGPGYSGTGFQNAKSVNAAPGAQTRGHTNRIMRSCENCGVSIGDLEVPQLWRGRIVCAPCHLRLATSEQRHTPPPSPTAEHFIALKCANCGGSLKAHEKTERVVCRYCGTELFVPRRTGLSSRAQRLVIERPRDWEEMLFSQVLADEIGKCADLKRDVDLGVAAGRGPSPRGVREVLGWVSSQLDEFLKVVHAIGALFTKAFPDAMGPPGTPADPDKLIYAATRIASQYRALLEWTLDCRRVNVEPDFRKVCNLLSSFVLNCTRETEDFSNKLQRDLAAAVAAHVPGKTRTIYAKLKLTVPDMTEFHKEVDRLNQLIS
jgi:DNA-directed RNA polymerase subunit RPC12/RpoP